LNNPRENSDAEQDSMTNRIDKFPPELCRMPKDLWMKRKKLADPEFSRTKKLTGPMCENTASNSTSTGTAAE
jgi:hypothetical protein